MHSTFGQNCTCSAATLRRCSSRESFTLVFKQGRVWDPQRSLEPAHQVEIDLGQGENRRFPEPDPDRRRQNGKTAPDAGAKHAPP